MQYSKKVIQHFQKPHNQGRIKNPDAVGQAGNPVCGDIMKIYLKIRKQENQPKADQPLVGKKISQRLTNRKQEKIIADIKFETMGCAAAIAVSSALTDLVKNKTLMQALKVDNKKIVKELGGLPSQKIHCSMLGVEALHQAIKKYQQSIIK